MIDFLLSGSLSFIFQPLFLNILKLIQNSMIFKPTNPEVGNIEPLLKPSEYKNYKLDNVEARELTTEDKVKITVWYKAAKKGKPTFLYLPGNTGHFGDCGCGRADDGGVIYEGRDYRLVQIQEIIKDGHGILAVCYRGFGTSDGKPSEEGLSIDAQTAYKFLIDSDISPRNIIVYGDSLGGAVAIKFIAQLTSNIAPALLITTGTFASISHKANDKYPQISREKFLPYLKHPFNSFEHIKKLINTKIILMHGSKDETTYPYHSELLVNSAMEANLDAKHILVTDAGHINIPAKEIVTNAIINYEKNKAV